MRPNIGRNKLTYNLGHANPPRPFPNNMTRSAIETLRRLNEMSDDELRDMLEKHQPGDLGEMIAKAMKR